MRDITLSTGTETIEPLTRKQIMDGRPLGFGYISFSIPAGQHDEAIDYVLDCAGFGGDAGPGANLTGPDVRAIFMAVIKETYGDGEEEKNSLPSGITSRTANGSSVATSAENGNSI